MMEQPTMEAAMHLDDEERSDPSLDLKAIQVLLKSDEVPHERGMLGFMQLIIRIIDFVHDLFFFAEMFQHVVSQKPGRRVDHLGTFPLMYRRAQVIDLSKQLFMLIVDLSYPHFQIWRP